VPLAVCFPRRGEWPRRGRSSFLEFGVRKAEVSALATSALAPDEGEQHGERVRLCPLWLAMQQRNTLLPGQVQVVRGRSGLLVIGDACLLAQAVPGRVSRRVARGDVYAAPRGGAPLEQTGDLSRYGLALGRTDSARSRKATTRRS
jgi:hypothetical protein